MSATATSVVVVALLLVLALIVFWALVRGVPEDRGYEVEVRLFLLTIRRKVEPRSPDPAEEPHHSGRYDADQPSLWRKLCRWMRS